MYKCAELSINVEKQCILCHINCVTLPSVIEVKDDVAYFIIIQKGILRISIIYLKEIYEDRTLYSTKQAQNA